MGPFHTYFYLHVFAVPISFDLSTFKVVVLILKIKLVICKTFRDSFNLDNSKINIKILFTNELHHYLFLFQS